MNQVSRSTSLNKAHSTNRKLCVSVSHFCSCLVGRVDLVQTRGTGVLSHAKGCKPITVIVNLLFHAWGKLRSLSPSRSSAEQSRAEQMREEMREEMRQGRRCRPGPVMTLISTLIAMKLTRSHGCCHSLIEEARLGVEVRAIPFLCWSPPGDVPRLDHHVTAEMRRSRGWKAGREDLLYLCLTEVYLSPTARWEGRRSHFLISY
jgi:hypothetical protein